jgi:hypothetical protein
MVAYAVSRVMDKKNRGWKTFVVRVVHIPSQGDATAFRSRSVAICRFCIRTLGGPAFLRSTRCATALVSRFMSPEGLTSVGEQLMCRLVSPGQLAGSTPCAAAGRLCLYLISSIYKIACDYRHWRARSSRAHICVDSHIILIESYKIVSIVSIIGMIE